MKFLFVCLFIFCAPMSSHASVSITEIVWKGSDEWIELYNDGSSSVDLEGWSVRRQKLGENSFDIEFTIGVDSKNPAGPFVLGAGKYAVLEKTDDDSSGAAALFIYPGNFNLLDGGLALKLVDDDNNLVDTLSSGENWTSVGGALEEGESAQYTGSAWVAAQATPGYRYNGNGVVQEDEDEDENDAETQEDEDVQENKKKNTSKSSSVSTLYNTPRTLQLSVSVPERTYVHQSIRMEVNSDGLASTILNSLEHRWNFGDFETGKGEKTVHRYEYPGEYVVTLHSQYGAYEAYTRKTITVLPVSFSLTNNTAGDIQIHNNAPYEVDMSGYRIVSGKTLRFPEGTVLLSSATITIPRERFSGQTNIFSLYDTVSTLVATKGVPKTKTPAPANNPPSTRKISKIISSNIPVQNGSFNFVNTAVIPEEVTRQAVVPEVVDTTQNAAVIETAQTLPVSKEQMPYVALLAVMGLGITAVFAGKVKNK